MIHILIVREGEAIDEVEDTRQEHKGNDNRH
jgi:hypothetical protein